MEKAKEKIEKLYKDGVTLMNIGKNKDAQKVFLEILEDEPEHVETINKLGVIYARINNIEKAKSYFNQARKIQPDNPQVLTNLGNTCLLEGELEKAKEYFDKSHTLDDKSHSTLDGLSAYYKKKGDIEASLKYYKLGQKIHRDQLKKKIKRNEQEYLDFDISETDSKSNQEPGSANKKKVSYKTIAFAAFGLLLLYLILFG
ncbi:tetratricopeptide repeat protein [Proteinivorax hydrogeniformans]|uniref:Tetratricopeptide repeat protein n=1 Tax=Proteinivorax hydrogeniformans TaxID=1826727 RepID=A0AAU8HT48_9FIRM